MCLLFHVSKSTLKAVALFASNDKENAFSPAGLISRGYSLRGKTISGNLRLASWHIVSISCDNRSVAWCRAHAGIWAEERLQARNSYSMRGVVHEDSEYVRTRAFRFLNCFSWGKWSCEYQNISKLCPVCVFAAATKPSCHVSQRFPCEERCDVRRIYYLRPLSLDKINRDYWF